MEKILSFVPLNWQLLRNPANWIIVILMITIAAMAIAFIMQQANGDNATDNGEV